MLRGVNDLDLSRFARGGFTGSDIGENSFDFGLNRSDTFFFTAEEEAGLARVAGVLPV